MKYNYKKLIVFRTKMILGMPLTNNEQAKWDKELNRDFGNNFQCDHEHTRLIYISLKRVSEFELTDKEQSLWDEWMYGDAKIYKRYNGKELQEMIDEIIEIRQSQKPFEEFLQEIEARDKRL